MTPFIANVFLSALSTIATTPQVEPDPALIAQLEQARPAAVGKNGADALYAIPQCTTTAVGLHLLNNDQNGLLSGAKAARLIEANATMLAEMLAESPVDTRLSAICDEIKVQPAENLSLCPRMYDEWRAISDVLQKSMQEGLTKMPFTDEQYRELGVNFFPNTMLTSLFNQAEAYALQEFSRSCSSENRAAVARGELPNLAPDSNIRAQNCGPYNGICIVIEGWDNTRYQASLLNVNRYLTALDYLRHPTDTPPAGYHIENNTLTFTRYPIRRNEEGMQTVTLPLPGSRL